MSHLTQITRLSPDVALLVLTLGIALIYLECNRPGWVLPGAIGLLLSLLAVASLLRVDLRPLAVLLTATAIALLLLNLLRLTPRPVAIAATVAIILGFDLLVRGPGEIKIHPVTAVLCGLILGAGTWLLTGVARRARTNKRVRLN